MTEITQSDDNSHLVPNVIEFPNVINDLQTRKRIIASGPCQPCGPFPKDVKQSGRSFSNNFFSFITKSGIKLNRSWLCYSQKLDCVYCQPCWLFPQQVEFVFSNPWRDSGVRDWKHITERIRSHEQSQHHTDSCIAYEQWRKYEIIDEALDKSLRQERNFWRNVLERVINVSLTLATCNLPFRGRSSKIEDSDKGNFLSIMELLSNYDSVLRNLLQKPTGIGIVNYLSPTIQNEIISLMAGEVSKEIISEIRSAPFFSIIMDTTQDIAKIDQLSEVYRYVKVLSDENNKPLKLKICETFTSFTEVKDQSASGLKSKIIQSIEEKGLDIKKCRGQSYDGASVMSGMYNGVQKKIQQIAPHAYFVHCASHNLNLVLKDAVDANHEISQFFDDIQSIYNFFGHSINHWLGLKNVSESSSNVTLKTLNPTRWAGRYEAVFALKERFGDVMKELSKLIVTSDKAKERNDAIGLKKKLESFDFVLLLVVQTKVLQQINIVSKCLQSESMDIVKAYDLLEETLSGIKEIRNSFKDFVKEASGICFKWAISCTFSEKRRSILKRHFDELSEDHRFRDPESRFKVLIFYPMLDTLCVQLEKRFEGMKSVINTYKVIQPYFLNSASDENLIKEAKEFAQKFPQDVSQTFPAQISSVRKAFLSKIKKMSNVKELVDFLFIENSTLVSTYPDVCTACFMYLTVPITVAKAERSFSKLKLIKTFLRSTMSQERLSGLALLSIENDRARKLNFSQIIDVFADIKSRKKPLK